MFLRRVVASCRGHEGLRLLQFFVGACGVLCAAEVSLDAKTRQRKGEVWGGVF